MQDVMGTCLSSVAAGGGGGGGQDKDKDDNKVEEEEETVVCKLSDLRTGKLVEAKLPGDRPCVLVKEPGGEVRALSGKCTHYGAPLAKGSYADGR